MHFETIKSSDGRKNYVFTVHGVGKAAMVDLELLEELIENTDYGISSKEILKRSKEETISLEELKKEMNV